MAVSRSMEEFGRRLQVVARGLGEGVATVVRKAALVADQVAVTQTPVDKGRARANWIVSTGAPAEEADQKPDPTGAAAMEQAAKVVAEYKPGEVIYITNNVEYIGALDAGHSKQAPAGMTASAIAAANQVIRDAQVLPK